MNQKPNRKLSIKEQLRLLLTVQDFDSKLLELDMRKAFFPDLLKQLKNELDNLAEEFESKRTRFTEVRTELGLLELDLTASREGLANSQKRLLNVTTNREYDAVQAEIQTRQLEITRAEHRSLQLLEEQEMLAEETTRLETELISKRDNSKGQIEEITKKSEEIDAITAQIVEKRDEITKEISPQLVNRYNQIRQGRQGIAIVTIVDRACGGCRQSLPPQTIQEIRAGKMTLCESCGRLIIDVDTDDTAQVA